MMRSALLACVLIAACNGRIGAIADASIIASDAAMIASDAAMIASDAAMIAPDAAMIAPDASEPDAGSPDAGCTQTLANSLTRTPLANVPSNASAYPIPSGGVAAAWSDGALIHVQRFDLTAAPLGVELTTAADGLYGLATSDDAIAVLAARGDVLALVVIAGDGTPIADHTIMGGVPHDVTNNEWFGTLLRAGRVDWTGSEWIAYATVQRLWPDGIAHYGDTLRAFAADGTPTNVSWDWGCSHSMDVRLAHNAAGIGAVCSSDCYPEKGVLFMWHTLLYGDSSGNCAGFVAQRIGELVALDDGYLASFVSGEGRGAPNGAKDAAIIRVGNDFQRGAITWLTETNEEEDSVHLARYGDGFLAAYLSGGSGRLQQLDGAGAPLGAPETIDAALLSNTSDFFALPGGEVAWVGGGELVRASVICR